jgi:hypothetical protein
MSGRRSECRAGRRSAHGRITVLTYSNGVRHVKIPDPDGNAIAFAEPPDAPERVTSVRRL